MGLGAILVIGAKSEAFIQGQPLRANECGVSEGPLPCAEILGRSIAERIIERFAKVDVDAIAVIVEADTAFRMPALQTSFANLSCEVEVAEDAGSALARKLREYSINGIKHAFVQGAESYTETDLMDLFYFHREARQTATRAFDCKGALALWAVDCAMPGQPDVIKTLSGAGRDGASYFVREYAHRLMHPRDLREIAADMLSGRCEKNFTGKEIRPGVWVDEGAKVHRRARIVGPAYIGRHSALRADTLITRCSSVERDCWVDYGTVIENSSLLPNTHVGIWLDVSHAVASGNRLFSLGRNVGIEISDPSVMRSTMPVLNADTTVSDWNEARLSAAEFQRDYLSHGTWQLGTNLIQE